MSDQPPGEVTFDRLVEQDADVGAAIALAAELRNSIAPSRQRRALPRELFEHVIERRPEDWPRRSVRGDRPVHCRHRCEPTDQHRCGTTDQPAESEHDQSSRITRSADTFRPRRNPHRRRRLLEGSVPLGGLVLGQPAGRDVGDTIADVDGVIAEPLVEAGHDGELYATWRSIVPAAWLSKICWMNWRCRSSR